MTMDTTCVRQANEAWLRPRDHDRDAQREDVATLHAYGVFSNRHLEAITGLPEQAVASLTRKRDRTGGRLNVETLPLLVRLAEDWSNGWLNERLVQMVIERGTSRRMVAKLTGIPEHVVTRNSR